MALENETMVRIGGTLAEVYGYQAAVGAIARVADHMHEPGFYEYYVVKTEETMRNTWFIQAVDCIPIETLNHDFLFLLKEGL